MSYRKVYSNDVSCKNVNAAEYGRKPILCPVCGQASTIMRLKITRNGVAIYSWIAADTDDLSTEEILEGFVCSSAKEEWHIVKKHELRRSGELKDTQYRDGYMYHDGFREY
ncbi:MAG: hypothetical protein A2928_03930 [Candidatus Taylorbacteria bacterium RIFCSPLOWO2_01_FULL_45_15b]|uniref:Uncharacterized protein n=1 Tax=Candidatus Taylorbacteria bacterium RIFCSPLOWO2_01_FULL_45_15b TaxID=1802319 RepID=A0A1G2NF16_9BACT|nr:MAG: hypothetical protein A2928_03930 [Candidatus Taylorbacteria bacterium RIFCSPLOWO2_01_FULL_45_15b]